jgi:hypothetical protein
MMVKQMADKPKSLTPTEREMILEQRKKSIAEIRSQLEELKNKYPIITRLLEERKRPR